MATTLVNPASNSVDGITTLNFENLLFSASNQSLWKAGNAQIYHPSLPFFGIDWNESLGKPRFGTKNNHIEFYGSTQGKVGLQPDFKVFDGTLSASLPVDLWLHFPDTVKPGEKITISSGFNLDNMATFSTNSPDAEFALDLVYALNAQAGVSGKYDVWFKKGSFNESILSVNVPETTKNLLKISAANQSFKIPESKLKGFGSFELSLPKIDTTGKLVSANMLSAKGKDSFFRASLDLDKVATTLLQSLGVPVPDLENQWSGGFKKTILGKKVNIFSASLGYNLFDLELTAGLDLGQKFDLTAKDLKGILTLETGDQLEFTVGKDLSFVVPQGIGNTLELSATLGLNTTFRNQTSLDYNTRLDIEALSLNGKLQVLPPIVDTSFKLGPAFKKSLTLSSGQIGKLYDETFLLKGFNSQALSFAIPSSTTVSPGHIYFLTNPASGKKWTDAENQAVAVGGHLVTINDAPENQWLVDKFGTRESFWIGLNDAKTEGQFEWVSGERANYRNWAVREPSGIGTGDEDYVELNPAFAPGKWNDRSVSASPIGGRGIVEVVSTLTGTAGNDTIFARGGNVTIAGGLGSDTIYGGDGDDLLRGDLNNSGAQGAAGGNDIIYGGRGNDRIGGKGGNDTLYGEQGNDEIWGDDGDDLLRGGLGNDTLIGGSGRDTFVMVVGEGTDIIKDFKIGTDLIGLAGGLTFGQLSKTQQGSNTLLKFNNEILAVLSGVNANALTASSFKVL